MSLLIILVIEGLILIAGMGGIVYMHVNFMKRMSNDMRTIAMFRKSRTLQDMAAMKSMGLNSEDWDKAEEKEDEEEDDGLRTAEELDDETLNKIAESNGE